jgi:hypothetical protein
MWPLFGLRFCAVARIVMWFRDQPLSAKASVNVTGRKKNGYVFEQVFAKLGSENFREI